MINKNKLHIRNKRAYHDYTILDTLEVGIALTGSEVKSIRQSQISIKDCYARIINEELWLIGCHITPYKQGDLFSNSNKIRDRRLLAHKQQIKRWLGKIEQKGYTLTVLKLYFNIKNKVKLEIGLAKSKKIYDKRRELKERAINRDGQQRLKS